ncbi:unnamed protein product [Symbiodinium sp. CCMP2456]|nr:unnamed protein product [Symbiodinium sp. CCMP2456]
MSLIEKRGEVTMVIDKVNDALERGEVLDEEGPEARSLADLVQRLRKESEKVWPKISSYERDIAQFSEKLSETQRQLLAIRDTPTRDSDDLRTHLKAQINQVKRMMAQLGRLRDIQRVNAQEIGMVERVRAKLFKQVRVRNLLAEGNPENMAMKIATLQEDTDRLRTTIKDLEAGLQPLTKEAADIIGKLREMPFEFTTETGKLREQLIANIHHESHWKERLAVLRGEKLQNIRFIALLKKALSQKSS